MNQPSQLTKIAIAPAWAVALYLMTGYSTASAVGNKVVSGELDVIIKEDFEHNRFETDYFLRDDNGVDWYELQFDRVPPGHLKSGKKITVRGQSKGKKFQVESLEEEGSIQSTQGSTTTNDAQLLLNAQALDERKAVVLMVNMTSATAGYSRDQIIGHMYTNARSVDGLYREASLGQLGFTPDADGDASPDVFGPFPINYDNSTCNYYDWAYAAEAAAQQAGIDLSLYRHRVFVLPNNLPSCSWAGIANVGCGTYCRAWIAGSTGMIFTHELGHNFNLAHAGSDPENDSVVNSVYGDTSDPMGYSSSSWYLFNAGHIDQMGWYANVPGAVTTVLSDGSYNLAAIGADPNSVGNAPFALKIAKPDTGDYYYVSYRQAIGNYNQLSTTYTKGVNIHRYKGSGYSATTHIKTLINGETFTDTANGISVTQLSQGSGIASVQVSFGCAALTPSLSVAPATQAVRPGTAVNLSISLANNDQASCGSTQFTLTAIGNVAGAWSGPSSFMLTPGQSGSTSLTANTSIADGSYTLSVAATDVDGQSPNHAVNGQGSSTVVIDGTAPSAPSSLSGSVNRQGKVVLSWQGSIDALSGVAGYRIIRNGVEIAQATGTGYTDTSVASATSYSYEVKAGDNAGNVSLASNMIAVTTGSGKGGKK